MPRAIAKLFWDLEHPVDAPVSSGELRSHVLLESYSAIWASGELRSRVPLQSYSGIWSVGWVCR